MDNLVQEEIADTTEEESDVDREFDISLPSPKIKSYTEVIQSLEVGRRLICRHNNGNNGARGARGAPGINGNNRKETEHKRSMWL